MLLIGTAFCAFAAVRAEAQPIQCPKQAGFLGGAMVPSPATAVEIYQAVARGRGFPILQDHEVRVMDDDDAWAVFQYPTNLPPGQIVAGGGTLDLKIDKCSGKILASLAR